MSETVTIARPYAQAVFRLARESSSLPLWSDRLQRLALIAQDADMASVMDNPKFSAAQLAELFLSLSGEGADQSLGSFIGLLAENERLTILPCIRELYEQLRSADEGIRDAQITSAFALDEQQLDNLTSQLEAHFGYWSDGDLECLEASQVDAGEFEGFYQINVNIRFRAG